jgi:secretion/DNA translocation related TadE-like protein
VRPGRCRDDRGSGTVLLLGVVAVVVVLAAGLGLLVSAQLARGRAQAAADLAALAAADELRGGPAGLGAAVGGSPCGVAGAVAERNGGRLISCRAEGLGVVRVQVAVGGRAGTASADARAGPVSARRAGAEASRAVPDG